MKLKKSLYVLFLSLMAVATSACSSDKDEPAKIIPAEDQPTEVTYAADTAVGNIRFTASASWSAYIAPTYRAADEISWITLNETHGSSGDVSLNFTLETNRSGNSRTAYINVICEDQTMSFKITQVAEDAPDEPDALPSEYDGLIDIRTARYTNGANGLEFDGYTYYVMRYKADRLVRMMCCYTDEVDGTDDYCDTEEETTVSYDEASGIAKAEIRRTDTYQPSGKNESEDSEHTLYYTISSNYYPLALSGSYFWPQESPTKFDFSYDVNGYLSQSRNDDGEEGNWDTTTFTWASGNLVQIASSQGNVSYEYSDATLMNNIKCFDLNWAIFNELEVMDFAAGDITKIWAVAGFLGTPSKNIATSITETDKYGTKRTYRATYKTHTAERTEVRVEEFVNNQQTGYTDWEISYIGNLK